MENLNIEIAIQHVILEDETFIDKDVVWKRIEHRIRQIDAARQSQHIHRLDRKSYWRVAVSIAAVICIAVGLGSRVNITSTDTELQCILPDGSTVELAEKSSIRYNRIGWLFSRRVTLDGNASFDVTKHKGTFSVKADMGVITVLGTRFAISQHSDNLHVACTEGCVEVKTDVGTQVLHKGEQLNYNSTQMQISPIYPEYLEFDNAPLSEVLPQIEQVYDLTATNKESCGEHMFSGWVSTQNRDEALEVVFGSCGLGYELNGDVLTINH